MLEVLLAEDNLADVVLVGQALQEYGVECRLHVVKDGAKALDFVARMGKSEDVPCPDLMLLDLNLPKATGAEVLAEFRKHPECAHTPVIVVSSSDAQADRDRVAKLGIAHYFRKPSNLESFLLLGAVVREVVAGKNAG
ncbi:MAG: response regulator [Acidobacteriota bacterium]|nr:response regulator [Acidobacteriota bacterium]